MFTRNTTLPPDVIQETDAPRTQTELLLGQFILLLLFVVAILLRWLT